MKKLILIVNLMLSTFAFINAQTGSVSGKVVDAATGEALIGATCIITGTTKGTITDFDGNYTLAGLTPGNYSISISYVSFETAQLDDIVVEGGTNKQLDVTLAPATASLNEVQVVARSRQRTEAALQVMQRKSAVVLDGISAQQISRIGDSDAAGALKRVTGVSVLGDKYVFVRGLSERYTKITLNGAEIPGLDPDVKTVQMDLFPSNIIENMVIHKTFSPDLPTFTGGHVDIITKDFPLEPTLNFSASFGYNTQSSFNNNFMTYETGKLDWLGMDDGTRDVPEIVKNKEWYPYLTPADSIGMFSKAFDNNWATTNKQSLFNQSYSLSYGNSWGQGGRKLGVIGALSYKKEYKFFENGLIEQLGRDGSTKTANLTQTFGQEEVIWSSLLGLTYKFTPYHKIGVNLLRNQSGSSGARYKEGTREVYPGGSRAQEISPEYVERSITSAQLNGKHVFSEANNLQIDWFGSYTASVQNEPDMRFWYNTYRITENEDTAYNMIPVTRPVRYYRYMDEKDLHGNIQVSIPLEQLLEKGKLKIGGDYITKNRNSNEYNFVLNALGGSAEYVGNPNNYTADEKMLSADNIFEGGAVYYGSLLLTNDIYSYRADETSTSVFIALDAPVNEKIRFGGGIKYEITDVFVENLVNSDSLSWSERYDQRWTNYQQIKTAYKSGSYSTKDLLPSFNFTYSITDRMNLRLNYWKSISKPALREIAPIDFYDFLSGLSYRGNEELVRGINFNYDFRWEYFFRPGELVSLSAFVKELRDPIEVKAPETAENIEYKYRNGEDTRIYGVETELRKKLDFSSATRNFELGFNLTLVYSQLEEEKERIDRIYLISDEAGDNFPKTRPMYGQAPYSINSNLAYNNPDIGLESILSFNISGPKLIIISQTAAPNIYEMPFPQLDFNIRKKLNDKISIKFAVKNILNTEHQVAYLNKSVDDLSDAPLGFLKSVEPEALFRSYTSGTEFSIGISMDLK